VEARYAGKIVEVDIAHGGERVGEALEKLEQALDRALMGDARGLRVIHGYGASGAPGVIGPRVRGWLRGEAARYGWKVVGDKYNAGATLVWFE
jgi:DNA-nicking Smr family endonuclease